MISHNLSIKDVMWNSLNSKLEFKSKATDLIITKINSTNDSFIIPPISHHIWLTNPNTPTEIRGDDFDNLKNTIEITSNWQHIFWTNCKTCLPESITNLQTLNIEIRNLEDYKDYLPSYTIVSDFTYKNVLGIAADLIRVDIIDKFGGFYSNLNYVLIKSPEELMKNYDFFAEGEQGIENYMFASLPYHPILNATLNISTSLLTDEKIISDLPTSVYTYHDLTNDFVYRPFMYAFDTYATKDTAVIRIHTPGNNCLKDTRDAESTYGSYLEKHETCSPLGFGYDNDLNGGSWRNTSTVTNE